MSEVKPDPHAESFLVELDPDTTVWVAATGVRIGNTVVFAYSGHKATTGSWGCCLAACPLGRPIDLANFGVYMGDVLPIEVSHRATTERVVNKVRAEVDLATFDPATNCYR
jgi:hypothetical protein